jgi:hypothetical protein
MVRRKTSPLVIRKRAPQKSRIVAYAALSASAGIALIIVVLASGAFAVGTISSGVLGSGAVIVSSDGASGGKAVEFGAVATPISPATIPVAATTPNSNGATAMPTTVPSGFTRAFTEDFNSPAALGSFASVYGSTFGEYDGDTSTNGVTKYDSSKVLSVANGSLYYNLHSEGGQSYAAAPQPWNYQSFTYGQVGMSVRLDSSNGPGYKIAFLLWPATNQWTNEVDFPEVDPDFIQPIRSVSLNTTTANGSHTFSGPTDTGYYLSDNKYHTFLLDWEPGKMTASIDGKLVETFPASAIPSQAMRLSLQAEGWIGQGAVPTATTDVLEVPWVYINTYN